MSDVKGTDEQEDAVLQIIGHHRGFTELRQPWRRDYQDVNAWNVIRTEKLPTFSKHTIGTPVTGLGILQELPLEVILNIVAEMGIQTTLRFRQANRRAYDLVQDQVSFRAVARHAHPCLMTVIDKGLGSSLTFDHIFRALVRPNCESCGKLACYLYVPTATKVCESCVATHDRFRTVSLEDFANATMSSIASIRRSITPMTVVLNGPEFRWDRDYRHRTSEVVNFLEASLLRHVIFDSDDEPEEEDVQARYRATVPLPTFNPATQTAYRHFVCNGCVWQSGWRINGWKVDRADMGRYLAAFDRCSRTYTRAELLEHFKTCMGARKIWELSGTGWNPAEALRGIRVELAWRSFVHVRHHFTAGDES